MSVGSERPLRSPLQTYRQPEARLLVAHARLLRRHRAAPVVGSRVETRRWISYPAPWTARESAASGLRSEKAKTSTAAPVAASDAAPRAIAFGRSMRALDQDLPRDAEREHRARSGSSRSARAPSARRRPAPPDSYAPIALCSAPWYAARSGSRSAARAGTRPSSAIIASREVLPLRELAGRGRGRAGHRRRDDHARVLEGQARRAQAGAGERDDGEGLGEPQRAAHHRRRCQAPAGERWAWPLTRPRSRRPCCEPRPPSGSARARGGRSGAPCRPGASCSRRSAHRPRRSSQHPPCQPCVEVCRKLDVGDRRALVGAVDEGRRGQHVELALRVKSVDDGRVERLAPPVRVGEARA